MSEHYYYLVNILAEKIKTRSTRYSPYLEDEIEELQCMIQKEIHGKS